VKIPVSVFYVVKNEADRLPLSIQSVREWVDEIVVVDSGSQDETCSVAKQCGADKILFNEWVGYGQQKRFAESRCTHKWLMNLDADEEISPDLKTNIISIFSEGDPKECAYRFKIRNMCSFEKKPSWVATVKTPIRLYDRTQASFRDDPVHDSVVVDELISDRRMVCLKGDVYHRSMRDLNHKISKMNHYSDLQAEKLFREGRYPSVLRVLVEGPVSFFKAYFSRRYFAYGLHGYIVALIWSSGRVARLAKARELRKVQTR